jgi:hypothetical protein
MVNINRMTVGETNPSFARAKASTVLSVGDIVVLSGSANALVAEKASTGVAWNTSLAQTQQDVHNAFLGVSGDQRLATQTTEGAVAAYTTGHAKFPCTTDANRRDIGTFYGVAQGTGNTTLDQQVVAVANASLAIGKLAKTKAATDTTVELEIVSSKTLGGVQATV